MPDDAAFGFAFLDIEVAFEIMVLSFLHDFSKSAQAKRDMPNEQVCLGEQNEYRRR